MRVKVASAFPSDIYTHNVRARHTSYAISLSLNPRFPLFLLRSVRFCELHGERVCECVARLRKTSVYDA